MKHSYTDEFLSTRLLLVGFSCPEIFKLKELLLEIGGTNILPSFDPHILALIKRAKVYKNLKRELNIGRPRSCHENSQVLAHKNGWDVNTGWALSNDGLWRQHSWCTHESRLIETTIIREVYWGIKL